MQHFLKSAPGAADAEVVAAELFLQFDIAMDDADHNAEHGPSDVAPLRSRLCWMLGFGGASLRSVLNGGHDEIVAGTYSRVPVVF